MDYIKSMSNYCKYSAATEGIGTTLVIAATAMITFAIAKAEIKYRIRKKRMDRYDKEYASGKVSKKTYDKAYKVKYDNLPYPEYVEARKEIDNKYGSSITKILQECQDNIKAQVKALCESKSEYKPLYKMIDFDDITRSDVVDNMLHLNYDVRILTMMSMQSIKAVIDDAELEDIEESKGFNALDFAVTKENIGAMKQMGMKILNEGTNKIYTIVKNEFAKAKAKVSALKYPGKFDIHEEDNPDDVYKTFSVILFMK